MRSIKTVFSCQFSVFSYWSLRSELYSPSGHPCGGMPGGHPLRRCEPQPNATFKVRTHVGADTIRPQTGYAEHKSSFQFSVFSFQLRVASLRFIQSSRTSLWRAFDKRPYGRCEPQINATLKIQVLRRGRRPRRPVEQDMRSIKAVFRCQFSVFCYGSLRSELYSPYGHPFGGRQIDAPTLVLTAIKRNI